MPCAQNQGGCGRTINSNIASDSSVLICTEGWRGPPSTGRGFLRRKLRGSLERDRMDRNPSPVSKFYPTVRWITGHDRLHLHELTSTELNFSSSGYGWIRFSLPSFYRFRIAL